jgi:hypothetical protein
MRANDDYGGLWLTETGWSAVPDDSEPARYLCEAFTLAAGTLARPLGGYDRICYFAFREGGGFGVLDPNDYPRPSFYAACQAANALTGKRFNGRVMTDDSSVRVYEFEDPADSLKTWVCWQNAGGRLVRSLSEGEVVPGRYEAKLPSGVLPAGVYFVRLETSDVSRQPLAVTKLVIQK